MLACSIMSWREFSTIYFTGALLPNTKYIFSYNFEIFNVYITYRISGMNEQIKSDKRNDINNLIFRESIIAIWINLTEIWTDQMRLNLREKFRTLPHRWERHEFKLRKRKIVQDGRDLNSMEAQKRNNRATWRPYWSFISTLSPRMRASILSDFKPQDIYLSKKMRCSKERERESFFNIDISMCRNDITAS